MALLPHPLQALKQRFYIRKEKGTKKMYDSENNFEEELHDFVTQMEKMRVNAMRARAIQNDFDLGYDIKALVETSSELNNWLRGVNEAIQWYADQPRRWAQALLANKNVMIFGFDIIGIAPPWKIVHKPWLVTRIFVINTRGKILYDTYIKPERSILETICKDANFSVRDFEAVLLTKLNKTAGKRVQNLQNIPSLTEAWPPLRNIILNAKDPNAPMVVDPPIVSCDLILHGKNIIGSHAHYYPQLAQDKVWMNLKWQRGFIDEAKFYFGESSIIDDDSPIIDDDRDLDLFCKRIEHPLPPRPEQTAEEQAIAQLRLLEAMAQGIGAQNLFAKEEEQARE